MAFSLIQRSGKYQTDGTGTGTITYSAGLANYGTTKRLLVSPFVHYSSVAAQGITSVAYNSPDAATERIKRGNPTNAVNQVAIYDLLAVATGGAHNTALTFAAAGSPDGHYVTGNTAEWSYAGTVSVVDTNSNDGNSNAPSVTTDATPQVGDLVVACFVLADGSNFTVTSSPAGTVEWTEGTVTGHESGEAVSRVVSVAGVQTFTWAISNSQNWSAVVAVYRDTTSAGAQLGKSPTQQLLTGSLPHLRMSPRSAREAQKHLRAQRRAYGFAAQL